MELLALVEYETRPGIRLDSAQRDALRGLVPSLAISPTPGREGLYDLTPGSHVGALNLPNGLAIEIRPKIPIDRLLFLVSYALDPRIWRSLPFDFAAQASLVEAVIPAFLHQVGRALRRGLLQGYRSEEDSLPGVRGRIRLDDQLRRRFGVFPPVEVRYDDFTEDIEPNRLIRAAVNRLERLRLRSPVSRSGLRRTRGALERVSLLEYSPLRLPEISWNRLNAHYQGAVELAKLILRSTSFDLGHGGARASAFLLDMNEVFEAFVVAALREALGLGSTEFPRGAQGRGVWLDRARRIRLEPDLSWWEGAACVFVGDVKYKRIGGSGVKNADLYQLLAYTVATGLPRGLLVYAAGECEPVAHEVVELGRKLEVRTLDLTGTPEDILEQIADLADRIRGMRGGPRR